MLCNEKTTHLGGFFIVTVQIAGELMGSMCI